MAGMARRPDSRTPSPNLRPRLVATLDPTNETELGLVVAPVNLQFLLYRIFVGK